MDKRTGRALHLLLSVQLTAAVFMMTGAAHATDVGAHLVHHATSENTTNAFSVFDHPLTDGQSHAIVHVTQNWNPDGVEGVYYDHVVGVLYDYGISKWAVFNQDGAAMPVGASFNVTVAAPKIFNDGFEAGNTSRWSVVVP